MARQLLKALADFVWRFSLGICYRNSTQTKTHMNIQKPILSTIRPRLVGSAVDALNFRQN